MRQSNIYTYAPGNGSLDVSKRDGNKVKMWEARKHLKTKGRTHYLTTHKLINLHGRPMLIPLVSRVNANTLEFNGKQYTYILGEPITDESNTHTIYISTRFEFVADGATHELKHISTKAALVFFLCCEGTHYQH